MIIIKMIILYFIQIRHTGDFPSTSIRLVCLIVCPRTTSLQPIHKRPANSPGHVQLFVCRRPYRHYTEHTPEPIEETLTSALVGLSEYYTTNQLRRVNPTKTQVSLFHLRNHECGEQLSISWNGGTSRSILAPH